MLPSSPSWLQRTLRLVRRERWAILALVPFALIALGFEVLPALRLFASSFSSDQGAGLTLANYRTIVTSRFYLMSLKNSLVLSLVSSLLGVLVGTLAAYALNRSSQRVRDALMTFISITVNFAGVPLAFAFIIILGESGALTLLTKEFGIHLYDAGFSIYTWTGLSLVYLYFQIPLATLLIYPAFFGIRKDWMEAAANLGATPSQFWAYIGMPTLAPAVLGTFAILMANALGAYATAYALTTGIYNILPLRISRLISGEVSYDPGLASAAAVVLGLIMVFFLVFNQLMLKRVRGVKS